MSNYDYSYMAEPATAGFSMVYTVILLAIAVLSIIALWKIFVKAGEEGWKAIIPFYNSYILYKLTWGNGFFFLLSLIPCVGFVFGIITSVKLAKAFGKSTAFAVGLIFLGPIFQLILGFDSSEYKGIQ